MTAAPALSPTILIVDDHPDILALLNRVVRQLAPNCTIVPVPDAETALGYVTQHAVLLVLTDYHMPRMTGLELTTMLKTSTPAMRVVLITAYDTAELRQRAQRCGVDDFLPKPFPLDSLEQIVRDVLA
jgi:two-component system response regulator (stage 0 sporulation protein F)